MSKTAPLSDSSSLLVPVHLEAWVVDQFTSSPGGLARFVADYDRLKQFESPIPTPFQDSSQQLEQGIHLHWALPDALTHGRVESSGSGLEFPAVPNRWMVARVNNSGGQWTGKLWVIKSDCLAPIDYGKTASAVTKDTTSIQVAGSGLSQPVGQAEQLSLVVDTGNTQGFVTAAAADQGADVIKIVPVSSLADPIPAGATLRLTTTSAFLNPHQPSYVKVDAAKGKTDITLNATSIGTRFSIEAWEAKPDVSDDALFLNAVGPGNISFAAYAPFVENVFSFVDRDLPPQEVNKDKFTYQVVGWYSNPDADPLQSLVQYDDLHNFWQQLWRDKKTWQSQSTSERFRTLLKHLSWSTSDTKQPPTRSLYHATLADVVWAYRPADGESPIDADKLQVVVGNTSIDALSALVAADNPGATGETLAELLQAAQYDFLKSYGQPGARVLVEQQIHQARFGSTPGGTLWEVVSQTPDHSNQDAKVPDLTRVQAEAVQTRLARLNAQQRACDEARRTLASNQGDLYAIWWTLGKANAPTGFGEGFDPPLNPPDQTPNWAELQPLLQSKLYPKLHDQVWAQLCDVQDKLGQLPNAIDSQSAQKWADQHWQLPGTPTKRAPKPPSTTLSALGLCLKSSTMPQFWHPNDPVVMIAGANRSQKHGEDGRYSSSGTLRCRLPGETITGLKIKGQPPFSITTLSDAGVKFDPLGSPTQVPDIKNLLAETFLVDPANSPIIASAVKGDAAEIAAAVTEQLSWDGTSTPPLGWDGKPPASFAMTLWQQAWSPLFLEWELHYFPTGSGQAADRQFNLDDWDFDGAEYRWKGTVAVTDPNTGHEKGSGFDPAYFVPFAGRSIITPQTPILLKEKIRSYLQDHSKIDKPDLEKLLQRVGDWDLLSQSLSGFNERLLTLNTDATFPPPPADPHEKIACPPGGKPPSIRALVGEQYDATPILSVAENTKFGGGRNQFYPVRGGFLQFQKMRIVDAFGQAYEIPVPNFDVIAAPGLVPSKPGGTASLPRGAIELPPRVVQPSRLDFRWLANDGSGLDIGVSNNSNPVCGWLLPNHLDGGVAVYDETGEALGEIFPPTTSDRWRPRPGEAGQKPPPKTIDGIKNQVLRDVLTSIVAASQPPNERAFDEWLRVIDETLWMVDPLGGRKDQMLSALIGRPLAVVQAKLQLRLLGDPAFNRLLEKAYAPKNYQKGVKAKPPWVRVQDHGIVDSLSFPVRLGSLQLPADGLIGYYFPSPTSSRKPYESFYAVHCPSGNSTVDEYIKPIRKRDAKTPTGWTYQGDLNLQFQDDAVTVTMLLDPRGSVHASTGILPTLSTALPGDRVEEFMKQLAVTFRAGPIITDPGTLRTSLPAEKHGTWTWLQRRSPTDWKEENTINANDRARLADDQLQLREGWLKFTKRDSKNNDT